MLRRIFVSLMLVCTSFLLSVNTVFAENIKLKHPENTLVMTLKTGKVYIELRPEWAEKHVERLKTLTKQGFYDGVVFHRVIAGFMAQTGDPTGTGTGSSELPDLKAEFNKNKHIRGTVSMARAGDPDSANSQFFICFDEAPFLDEQYTAFGQVISGMEHIDTLKKGESSQNGLVTDPDKIISMQIASDIKK
jgi:peptidylprolyl isomerase